MATKKNDTATRRRGEAAKPVEVVNKQAQSQAAEEPKDLMPCLVLKANDPRHMRAVVLLAQHGLVDERLVREFELFEERNR